MQRQPSQALRASSPRGRASGVSVRSMLDARGPIGRKRAGLATEGRSVFVQPLSLTPFDSSPSRGASGETVHFAGTAKASPTRGGGTASAVTERLYEGRGFGRPEGAKKPFGDCRSERGRVSGEVSNYQRIIVANQTSSGWRTSGQLAKFELRQSGELRQVGEQSILNYISSIL